MLCKRSILQTAALRRIAVFHTHLTKPHAKIVSLQSNFTSNQRKPTKTHHQLTRNDFEYSTKIQTRWMDNDIYGHVNNVVYYSYFDTVVNRFLIEKGELKIHDDKYDLLNPVLTIRHDNNNNDNAIGVVVESNCQYFKSLSFPDIVVACLRVKTLGKSRYKEMYFFKNESVTYEIGIFPENETLSICAFGFFVHVFVDRDSRKPVPIPDKMRKALQNIFHDSTHSTLNHKL